ncbi:MAG: T9SS type A sorting domain-containing protein, partial [Saprospiraceae bacterium]|nr:T9SS type A sorting domain-containing protein [Saprospiraceae bacterium]
SGLPQSDCGLGTANITVEILNEGFFALNAGDSVELTYSDGFNLITETILLSTNFNPQDTLTYTFLAAADFSTTGAIYNSQVWTMYAADSLNTSNDTLMGAMVQHIPTISSFPYNEDFENGQAGWTADNTTNGSWAFGTPLKRTIFGAASGANAWTTGGLGQDFYNADEQSWVRSPCFDFSNVCDPKIEMDVWWVTEESWDGANLQASTDGGQTWQLVGNFGEAFNWYNNNATNASPGGFSEAWSGGGQGTGNGSGTWVTVRHSLAGLDSLSSVSLRVSFGSDNVFHDDGFAFDNVRIFDGVNLSDNYPVGLGLCGADSIEINVSGGVNDVYNWSTGSSDSAIWVSTAGNYAVTVTSTDGCVNIDTLSVVAGAPITVDLGADTIGSCSQYIMDAGTGYASYTWSTGAATQVDTVDFNGWYSVTVSNSTGCTAEDSVFVEIYFDPFIDLGADITTCLTHTIDAGGGFVSYLWSNGDTTQQSIVSSSSVYTVSATNTDGCVAVDSIFVDITGVSTVDLGQDTTVCSTYTIDAGTDPDTYLWSTGDTTASITVTSSGVYTIEASADGCPPAFDTINVTVNAAPTVNIGQDTSICAGTILDLDAGAGFVSYLWSTGSTQQTVTVTNPTVYSVTVTDANGCVGNSNSILLQNLPIPVVDLGQDTSICLGDSVVLDAGSTFDSYLWSTGNTTPKTTVSQSGVYSVTVTDANTCEGVDSIFVTVDTCVNVFKHESVYSCTIFPNPSQGSLNVEVERVDVQAIRVYDVYGRLVHTHWVQDPKQILYNLDVNTLENGQYWLSVETKEGVLNKAFIKMD